MQTFPRISVVDPRTDDVLLEVTLIPEADAGAFVAEIAHELGALLGVSREVALELFAVDLRDSVALPVPDCFQVSAQTRRAFAKDVAAVVRAAIGAGARAAA